MELGARHKTVYRLKLSDRVILILFMKSGFERDINILGGSRKNHNS